MDGATVEGALRGAGFEAVRAAIRSGAHGGHTAGLAPGRLQVNLAMLPAGIAEDFLGFCRANPKPCPLVAMSPAPGDPRLPEIGEDVDACTDAAGYVLWRRGEAVAEASDARGWWRGDMVAFALGCSFTFERALAAAGLPLRHVEADVTVPMYRSGIETARVGPFGGGMVVSMRPMPAGGVDRVREITARFPQAHGAPVHVGDPAAIGIAALAAPDWGAAVEVRPGEVPVFWACGVTPQNALAAARPEFCITHRPGAMLIAERAEDAETPLL